MTDARSPRIGITTRTSRKTYQDRWFRNYWWAILWAGGDPVVLTPETTNLSADEQVAQLDGLFLPGGGDVHPSYYHQPLAGSDPKDIHLERDELELSLARAALAVDLPVLGVCRGLQVLNIAAEGGLLQHVDGHKSAAGKTRYHDVHVYPDTLLARVLRGSGKLSTNTYHHQAVTRETLASGFRASASTTAASEPKAPPLLEAMEGIGWRWVLAVQWHPERFFELAPAHRRLFTAFVEASSQQR